MQQFNNLESARLAQRPKINAFVRVKLDARQALGQRQYRQFNPADQPLNFLDAVRRALVAAVANHDIEHFWAAFNLEWPDANTRSNVSFRQIPPLDCLLTKSTAESSAVGEGARPMDTRSSSSEEDTNETEVQVRDWRFSELQTADLASLREVDLCVPFRIPPIRSPHWRNYVAVYTRRAPFRGKAEWYDAITAHWASHKGLAASANATKELSTAPGPSCTSTKQFPVETEENKTVNLHEVKEAIKSMWRAATTKLVDLRTVQVPAGIPPWRAEPEEISEEATEVEDTSPQGDVPSGTSPWLTNVSASSAWRHSHLDAVARHGRGSRQVPSLLAPSTCAGRGNALHRWSFSSNGWWFCFLATLPHFAASSFAA